MVLEEENEFLIQHMKNSGILRSKLLERAVREVPRHLFIPKDLLGLAYRDAPLSIGYNQTISQPSTVVAMTEALDLKENQKVLEVGSGSGWQSAIISKVIKNGFVYTVEIVKKLADFARDNLKKANIKNVKVIHGDGSLGLKENSPYDRIIVTAACPDIPKPLIEQLKVNGKIVIPVGSLYIQTMFVITKLSKDKLEKESIGYFMFVPLTGKYGFKY